MLLSVRFPGADGGELSALLGDEEERQIEIPYGETFAWIEADTVPPAIHFSVVVRTGSVVARTKRRDKEDRFSIGFCDSYSSTASGLMALFLARLRVAAAFERRRIQVDLFSYPDRPYGAEIARRIFAPAGYEIELENGRLRLEGEGSLGELPALLLTLDRRTRMFLTRDELDEIGERSMVSTHPAARAIGLALSGKPTPLRFLVPDYSPVRDGKAQDDLTAVRNLTQPISTRLVSQIRLAESQQDFALRAFSKVNIDRRWLIYLPSAISSRQACKKTGELERPEDALGYFRDERIDKAIVEEKHMGSRGIVVVCRSHKAALERFGVSGETPGCVYTRNGRRFFKDEDTEAVFLERTERVLSRAKFWERNSTDWVCFDGEILPWAVKASESSEESDLVQAGSLVLSETEKALGETSNSASKLYWQGVLSRERAALERYDLMFKKYRTESADLAALKFAPFHLLAVEGQTFFHRSHLWHMQTLSRLARSGDGFVIPTKYEVVTTNQPKTWSKVLNWWERLSADFSEGFVVKPLPFVPRGRRGLAQPALKCRSREHLRLVYGPNYDSAESRESLISRDSLLHRRNKHRRILRQFALSMEAVTRFVQRSPLDAVHECVLGVLAQEVAPMDQI